MPCGYSWLAEIFALRVLVDAEGANARGAMFVGGQLFHADSDGRMCSSRFENGSFEPGRAGEPGRPGRERVGAVQARRHVLRLRTGPGLPCHTVQGDARLSWRAFTPAGPYHGNEVHVVEQQCDIPWSNVRGMAWSRTSCTSATPTTISTVPTSFRFDVAAGEQVDARRSRGNPDAPV